MSALPGPPSASIAPWLSVLRGTEAVAFYQEAFGAVELHGHAGESGEIVSQLMVGGAEFWVADDRECSPETLGAGSVRMIVSVDDPDALFAPRGRGRGNRDRRHVRGSRLAHRPRARPVRPSLGARPPAGLTGCHPCGARGARLRARKLRG